MTNNSSKVSYKLVSHHLCPYVQRVAISLHEKEIPFDRVYIDLTDKPDWFKSMSPLGRVPVLEIDTGHSSTQLFESIVILEYLEDVHDVSLFPEDALERAENRAWIEFGSTILNDIARFYSAKSNSEFTLMRNVLREKFNRVEQQLGDGPYFNGALFSLVDAVYGPIFRYFDVLDLIHEFGILDGFSKILSWRLSLSQRASIREAVASDYVERLMVFFKARDSYLSMIAENNSLFHGPTDERKSLVLNKR